MPSHIYATLVEGASALDNKNPGTPPRICNRYLALPYGLR